MAGRFLYAPSLFSVRFSIFPLSLPQNYCILYRDATSYGGSQWKKANCSTKSGLAYGSGILAYELNKRTSIGSNDSLCSTINATLAKWGKKKSRRSCRISLLSERFLHPLKIKPL